MADTSDPYADLKRHQLPYATQSSEEYRVPFEPRVVSKRRSQFVKVPWPWIDRLQGASGQTYRVALYLLHLHWKNGKQAVTLPNGQLKLDGVSRQSKWRGLAELERRGLIVVERRAKKSPIISLNLPDS